jgi:hypothetical protein
MFLGGMEVKVLTLVQLPFLTLIYIMFLGGQKMVEESRITKNSMVPILPILSSNSTYDSKRA